MSVDEILGTLAIIVGAGLVAQVFADLLRVPAMILLLAAGAILGPHATGAIDVPLASDGARVLLSLGVAFILFHGGLNLSVRVLSRTVVGLLLLVVPGVLLTALIVGAVAGAAFSVPLVAGLMIGAALAPIDPAILIPLFERLRLRPKLAQTIVAESALNDATGAVLTLALAVAVAGAETSLGTPALDFVTELAVSTGLGIVFGVLLSLLISSRRAGIWQESAALVVLAVLAASWVSIDSAGGSGYLGAFIAGLIVGNMDELRLAMRGPNERDMRSLVEAVMDVVVILVFVVLGANLPFDELRDEALPAIAVVATLLLVARPLVVLACVLPDRRGRWTREEVVFLAWTRETGVVSAALAGVLVAKGVPHAELVVVTVALAVVATLLLQTTTKPWLARRLGLLEPADQIRPD
ncbi:MAG: cation:proton antiporter [Gaiellaceae bacterium]